MDNELKMILGQIIDNQISLNRKFDELIRVTNNLTNTIIKYDDEYQKEILGDINDINNSHIRHN